jgi:hypothetical protein
VASSPSATAGSTLVRSAEKARGVIERTPGPARAAGLAAAGLAGGLALGAGIGSRRKAFAFGFLPRPRRKILGVAVGRKPSSVAAGQAFADGARRLAGTGQKVLRAADDVHAVRRQLEQANRQSPVEVLLDGLTHRRGAHAREN